MEFFEIILIMLLILGALLSMIVSEPMRRHLKKDTKHKKISFFQMPFYLKDYYKMLTEITDSRKKRRYNVFFIIFMTSTLVFMISGIVLLVLP